MGIKEADDAMSAFESKTLPFDSNKVMYYKSQLRKYVKQKLSDFPDKPALFDPSDGQTILPTGLSDRIEKWMTAHPSYPPFMRRFATYYIISLLDDRCHVGLLTHLAECALAGGDFYHESGMFYLRDGQGVSAIRVTED